ncbi:MAG TPA: hypothetical protein VI792_12645 [Candidatus Eisenbacteria bacterium]
MPHPPALTARRGAPDAHASARSPGTSGSRPRAGRRPPLEQLALDLACDPPRWSLSRLVERSPHRPRILERLEFVRRFFPEMNGATIRIGLARKRGVLGWGSLDPERPAVWVRPRLTHYFTIAHEFTHLLQARGLVPRGERSCDLWALARSPLLIDSPPGYLRLPRALRDRRSLEPWLPAVLHETACRAIAARARGDRRYLRRFEREVAAALAARR